jgi:predicted amidohydrolase YtcJ
VILENGRVLTLDPSLPAMGAIAITRDGRVARGVEAWEGDRSAVSTERIDLDGRCVVPGLVDAHVHFLSWALLRASLDLNDQRSVAGCLAAVAEAPPGGPDGWLLGHGWVADRLADGPPTARALDGVTGERPAALWAHDHHSLWLNGAALRALGVDRHAQAPAGGVIERGPDGEPTGVVREEAAWRLPLPEPGPTERRRAVHDGQRAAHALGVTGVHDFEARHGVGLWQELDADRRLTLRVLASQPAAHLDALLATELRSGFGGERLQLGPVKAFLDGTLGSRTAAMLEPYADGAGSGLDLLAAAAFEELVRRASAGGLNVAVHAIGDRANRAALDAYAATRDVWEPAGLRPRIEHAQILAPGDAERLAELGIVASVQPTHATSDRDAADRALGPRAAGAYAWRTLHDAGAVLALGSDAPIEPLDPLAGVRAAVARTVDERPPWRPEQALDALEALAGFTVGPAWASGHERRRGRLIPGYDADLVVLEGDPTRLPPERLGEVRVVATMVGGRWVHGRPPW